MKDAMEVLRSRRSHRKYKSDPVPRELIEQIIDAARLAATARNVQPWCFIVVTDPNTRKKIASLAPNGRFIEDAPVCIAVLCEDTKYYLEDGSAATENILLAAEALGLGSCWVAGDKKPYASTVVKLLGAPESYKLVSLITIGYSADDSQRSIKKSLDEVLRWEKF